MEDMLEKLLNNPQTSKMFNFVTVTWNPVVGCKHLCKYCWARRLATTKLSNSHRYKDGFKPKLIEKELSRKFKKSDFVFVSDMGDLFGDWVPEEWVVKVLYHIRKFPYTYFLLLTKNPKRYIEFLDIIPSNCIIGSTIETNRDTSKFSNAPSPAFRINSMKKIRKKWNGYIMIAIEPVMDFDTEKFVLELKAVQPNFVVIGKDNYNNNLPEPSEEKLSEFIQKIKKFTKVIVKNNIKYLVKNNKSRKRKRKAQENGSKKDINSLQKSIKKLFMLLNIYINHLMR